MFAGFAVDKLFLSTLPARGATGEDREYRRGNGYFYPRSPRGERHTSFATRILLNNISIHAPREGSDRHQPVVLETLATISIHAPREGSDTPVTLEQAYNNLFLSTLPARGATASTS